MDQQLQNICYWGKFDELENYDQNKFNQKNLLLAIRYMASLLQNIEIRETENNNQDPHIFKNQSDRSLAIQKCLAYIIYLKLHRPTTLPKSFSKLQQKSTFVKVLTKTLTKTF
jgi:hypothetical protein